MERYKVYYILIVIIFILLHFNSNYIYITTF
jgi:hypothetical protein